MRLSEFFIDTLREVPTDADVISQKLMMRSSMIRKLAAGIYTYLPLGLRVIKKVEAIVRNHMNSAGAIELLMPAVQPSELWIESGRWGYYGKELLRLKDRHNRDFCIGPTHEEVITDIVRNAIRSYKQMPKTFYQIQTKFRDEVRPRFGLMRSREFIMKDAYSFDLTDADAELSYKKMYNAYNDIFRACGLAYKIVDADSGAIGGSFSHEFMVTADTGEDQIISCNKCDYSANIEKAVVVYEQRDRDVQQEKLELKKVSTPATHTVEEVAKFLDIDINCVVKSMIVRADDKFYITLIRGDHELNIAKFKNYIGAVTCELATSKEVVAITSGAVGFSGPIGIGQDIPIYADNAIKDIVNIVVGANEQDFHYINANANDDFKVESFADLRDAIEGDICSVCGGRYHTIRGIEVGHIFKLGTKYSDVLKAKYLDKNGKSNAIVMGCYGVGIGRTVAAAIEQNHDDKGIIFPKAIAPFEVVIIPASNDHEDVAKISEDIYSKLIDRNVDVLIDDRSERLGVKLNDAELIGYPIYITIGKRSLEESSIELTIRETLEKKSIPLDNVIDSIVSILDQAK